MNEKPRPSEVPADCIAYQVDAQLLLKKIREHPCLWNESDPQFHCKLSHNQAWKSIATATRCPGKVCQRAWVGLKNAWDRNQESKPARSFRFARDMAFMKPIDERKLLREIQKHPVLYDKGNAPLLRLRIVWDSISVAMGRTVEECKAKFKALKTARRNHQAHASWDKPFKWEAEMAFLDGIEEEYKDDVDTSQVVVDEPSESYAAAATDQQDSYTVTDQPDSYTVTDQQESFTAASTAEQHDSFTFSPAKRKRLAVSDQGDVFLSDLDADLSAAGPSRRPSTVQPMNYIEKIAVEFVDCINEIKQPRLRNEAIVELKQLAHSFWQKYIFDQFDKSNEEH